MARVYTICKGCKDKKGVYCDSKENRCTRIPFVCICVCLCVWGGGGGGGNMYVLCVCFCLYISKDDFKVNYKQVGEFPIKKNENSSQVNEPYNHYPT